MIKALLFQAKNLLFSRLHIYYDVTTIFLKVVVAFHENEQISVSWELTNFG